MNFNLAKFVTSASRLAECPADSVCEVAFAGRSNAGKSSALNSIVGQTGLARISKTPGRTQLINYFQFQAGHYLVDLPGYGFAKVPLAVKDKWQKELENYLRRRQPLIGLVLLNDIRHPLKEFDRQMVEWAHQSNLPLHLLLTKCDKLKQGAAKNTLLAVQKELANYEQLSIQLFSALKTEGIDTARQQLQHWFESMSSRT
ncbi:MAG: ribosome biogenesis GTP-binding protein YihA/YsxC [Pseudohongiellaceae bacterium]